MIRKNTGTDGVDDRSAEAAMRLLEARRTGRTIAVLPDGLKPGTFAGAYRIQDRLLELDGRPVALVKVGCIDGPSVVADNSMATAVVLGTIVELADGFDARRLASTEVRLAAETPDGLELITEGVGSNVLGDPWRSFHWALGHLAARGRAISAGTWIITGSCSGAPVAPVDRRLTAGFEGLGDVSVTISG